MTVEFANDIGPVIDRIIAEVEPQLIALRRDLHAHPETGFDTHRTAATLADQLRNLGLEVRSGVGRTGLVAEITGEANGPCVILRADMDALPIHEETGLPFASQTAGQMHACGHDLHSASLLGAAMALVRIKPHLAGTVRLVFQPAEETLESGAEAMIADGAAEGADMAVAFHNQPELPVGDLVFIEGASTASSDEFKVVVKGVSGHAARPHLASDPIVTAAYLITQLQSIVSRRMSPTDPLVLTIGQISGGFTENIIPDSCSFIGTVRCRSPQARDMAEAALRKICEDGAQAMGLEAEVTYRRGAPALQNNAQLVAKARTALTEHFPQTPRLETSGDFGAEDFSYFSERLPALQLLIGSGQPGRDDRLHNSDYQPDEANIAISARALARMAVALLADPIAPAKPL